ncbi:MAG: PTS sugar transporter subunit IIA [Planctomycetota bacterium]|nr:PTS sugar transporter subunit IIA [Planctomycetota bacterium]
MSKEDFDIDALASYLHLLPKQVSRMADRGKLPGRKVAGKWRFSRSEIHHWLEERIGAADEDDELARVEGVLERAEDFATDSISLQELLSPAAMAVPLAARTRDSVITQMVQLASSTGMLWDAEKMIEAVRAREEMHPTALSCGVALMHPRRPIPAILSQPFLAMGRTIQQIPFGGSQGHLTDIFFLICSDSDHNHLKTLARLSRLINDPQLLDRLRAAPDAQTSYEILVEGDQQLSE